MALSPLPVQPSSNSPGNALCPFVDTPASDFKEDLEGDSESCPSAGPETWGTQSNTLYATMGTRLFYDAKPYLKPPL